MKIGLVPAILAVFSVSSPSAQSGTPVLKDGVINYQDERGQRAQGQAGGPCADLWVSPDGSTIAFIRIDKSEPGDIGTEPFIQESNIFLARRSSGFVPIRISFPVPKIDGRAWKVFRNPSMSPDLKTVYFAVPATATSWFLMSVPSTGGAALPIDFVEAYCVLWGGAQSGEVLTMARRMGSPEEGLTHWYYRVGPALAKTKVGSRETGGDFGRFVTAWTRSHGGTCQGGLD